MKTYILILLLPLCGCIRTVPPPVDAITVLIDRTDSNYCSTDAMEEQITKRLALYGNEYAGASIRFTSISHFKMNDTKVISISPTDMLNINEPERLKEITAFKRNLILQLRKMATVEAPQDESEVFHAIFTSLRKPGTVICFSDLMQHNEFFDAYDPEQMQRLKDHPEELSAKIDSLYPLPRTAHNTTLVLNYCPNSKETDEAFYIISSWLKRYLQGKEIRVLVGSEE